MNLKKLIVFLSVFGLMGSLAHPAEALGTRKICLNWQYSFTDQGGEDYLRHVPGTIFGTINAKHAIAHVYRDSSVVWLGWLDGSGCTPQLSGDSGTYSVWLWTAAFGGGSNPFVRVWNDDTNQELFGYNWQGFLPAVPTGQLYLDDKDLGGGASAADAMAVWTRMLEVNDGRVTANKAYTVILLENCPGLTGSACYDSDFDAVYLGTDAQGNKAKRKFLVAHEIGHNLHHWLFGTPYKPYTQDAPPVSGPDYCRCDHIPDVNLQGHCMQSREHAGAAQIEGFAHFNGADAFNSGTDSTAEFTYYKHVLLPPGTTTTPPPNHWWAFYSTPYHWKDAHCPASGSNSTELDWMTFFYELNNKTTDKYSFADIKSVYLQACGGTCVDGVADTVTWSTFITAVPAVFGSGTLKTGYWMNQGNEHGVDDS